MDRGSGPSNARFLEDVGAVAARLEPGEGHSQGIVKAIAGRDILCAVVVMMVVGTVVRGILDLARRPANHRSRVFMHGASIVVSRPLG